MDIQTPITQEYRDNAEEMLANAIGTVKLYTGVINNCAYYVMHNAYCNVKRSPIFKQKVKRAFNAAMKKYVDYEWKLMHKYKNNMFDLNSMPEEARSKYGELTKQQMFDYWQGGGGAGYVRSQNELNVLKHKYYLSLSQHNVPYAKEVADAALASACLSIASKMYKSMEDEVRVLLPLLTEYALDETIRQFDIRFVAKAWDYALQTMCTDVSDYELDDFDARNQDMAIRQLEDKWASEDFIYGSFSDAIGDYSEVFVSKKEAKKAQRFVAMVRKEMKES